MCRFACIQRYERIGIESLFHSVAFINYAALLFDKFATVCHSPERH